jgi:hypothetical protein
MPLWSSVFPIFSWINFTVSDLTLKSFIHFELIQVQGESVGSSFSFVQVEIQLSQHHLLKRLSFLQSIFGTLVGN